MLYYTPVYRIRQKDSKWALTLRGRCFLLSFAFFYVLFSAKWRVQNKRIKEDRHFKAYVEHLKENNAAATIQSDLSGIRYFHRKSGSKNRLSPNSKLALPKRATGVKDHSLLDNKLLPFIKKFHSSDYLKWVLKSYEWNLSLYYGKRKDLVNCNSLQGRWCG